MEQNIKSANQVEYMLVENRVKLNKAGCWYSQVEDTMTYKRLCNAVSKRQAIYKDYSWGYCEGDIMIARLEIVR